MLLTYIVKEQMLIYGLIIRIPNNYISYFPLLKRIISDNLLILDWKWIEIGCIIAFRLLKLSLRKFYARHHYWVKCYGTSVSQMTADIVPLVVNTFRSFSHSLLITGFVTRVVWWVPWVEKELLSFPEHLSSTPGFSGDHAIVDRCFPYGLFLLSIVLSVIGFMDSDYPFVIFKLLLFQMSY